MTFPYEELARDRIQTRLSEAEAERTARRLVAVRRARRKAERAAARLRRALMLAG